MINVTDDKKLGYNCAMAGLGVMLNYQFAQQFIEIKDVEKSVHYLTKLSNNLSKIEICGTERQKDRQKHIEDALIEITIGNWEQAKVELKEVGTRIEGITPERG